MAFVLSGTGIALFVFDCEAGTKACRALNSTKISLVTDLFNELSFLLSFSKDFPP